MNDSQRPNQSPLKRAHAIVIGGSMAGLLAARVLLKHFEQVTLVERDRFPDQPQSRQGVPQSQHVHILLTEGQRLLEQLFPGLAAELTAAGAPTVNWTEDWLMLGVWGWHPQCPSDLLGRACSRTLLEWSILQRLVAYPHLQLLQGYQVKGLLHNADQSQVTGVQLKRHCASADATQSPLDSLTADLVVDASGRNSALPSWLTAMGYRAPPEDTINAFVGYASRWYQRPSSFQADWKGVTVSARAGVNSSGGVLYPIEGDRWIVTLGGVGRNYPPTDDVGFVDFAHSLSDPIIYEAIKAAKPLSPIYSYRATANRWRHYERLARMPAGLVALGDAVCAFNPVYGQGMTVAALGASTLDHCLKRQSHRLQSSQVEFTRSFQQQLALLIMTPWLMATGEDGRWNTTVGAKNDHLSQLLQQYMDRVILLSTNNAELFRVFVEVVHMVRNPLTLFQPWIFLQVLVSYGTSRLGQPAIPSQPDHF